jgi:hypothetical protein
VIDSVGPAGAEFGLPTMRSWARKASRSLVAPRLTISVRHPTHSAPTRCAEDAGAVHPSPLVASAPSLECKLWSISEWTGVGLAGTSSQSAEVGIGGLGRLDADPGVGDLGVVRAGHDRAQFELGDLRQVVGHLGHQLAGLPLAQAVEVGHPPLRVARHMP